MRLVLLPLSLLLLLARAGAPPPSGSSCSAADREAAASAVSSSACAAHHVVSPWLTAPHTLGSLYALHACVADAGVRTLPSHFAVVVMCSSVKPERVVRTRASWGGAASAAGTEVLYMLDAGDAAATGGVVLEDALARAPTYEGAQHRSLRGLQHAVAAHPTARWYWLVDDDTFWDIHVMASIVRHLDPAMPVAVGCVFAGQMRWNVFPQTSLSGGAGMLLSAAAAHALAAALYTPACPFDKLNDITLSHCAYTLGIAMVHHPALSPEWDPIVVDYVGERNLATILAMASVHRTDPWVGYPTLNNEVLGRDGLSWQLRRLPEEGAPAWTWGA